MSKKTNSLSAVIIGVIAVLVIAIGAYALGQRSGGANDENLLPGRLEISETQYDFGIIGLDKVSRTFVIKNVGEGPLTIERVSTSCGCTTAQLKKDGKTSVTFGMDHGNLPKANMVLGPGEETDIVVSYNPLAHGLSKAAGTFTRVVYIQTSNPRQESEIAISMTVDPDMSNE